MTYQRDWKHLTLRDAQPYWTLGLLAPRHIADVASNEMLAGGKGTALGVLASEELDHDEIDRWLQSALAEEGIPSMDRNAALRAVFRDVLDDILAGRIGPIEGATLLSELDPEWEVPELQGPVFGGLVDEAQRFASRQPGSWKPEWGPAPTLAEAEEDIVELAREVRHALNATPAPDEDTRPRGSGDAGDK